MLLERYKAYYSISISIRIARLRSLTGCGAVFSYLTMLKVVRYDYYPEEQSG